MVAERAWRRWRAPAVAAGVALALLTGCTSTPASPPTPAQRLSDPGEMVEYVALGDSFSAGPFIPVVRQDPLGCGRSTNNYPARLARLLDLPQYTDVTCSGARTEHLRRPQPLFLGDVNEPQLDALTTGTDLVTVGLGGNDFGLFGSLTQTCPRVRERDPDGAPCREELTRTVDGREVDTMARAARWVARRLESGLERVQRRAPAAEVLVVGYPRLLPPTGTCRTAGFATGDYPWLTRVERLLNRSLRLAAEAVGATYVSTWEASRGHDACAGRDAWVNGSRGENGRAAAYHPLKRGMRGVAEVVYDALETAPSG